MALIKMNPLFADLAAVTNRWHRLLGHDDVLGPEGLVEAGTWVPAVDIFEGEHEVVMKAELPGLEAKDVTIAVENNVLTLKGERRAETDVKKENYHRVERSFGAFCRAFALPATLDSDRVTAEFKNGLLTITLPKKETVKPRTIEVRAA
jgi:HSP20 family protein